MIPHQQQQLQQMSRDQQINLFAGNLEGLRVKLQAIEASRTALTKAVTELSYVGPLPSLKDVQKIADGIRLMAQSQLTLISLELGGVQNQMKVLEQALVELRSPIARAGLVPPSGLGGGGLGRM